MNILAHRLGLHVSPLETVQNRFALFSYKRDDGGFDYETYKAVQTAGNHRKIDWVFAVEQNIDVACDYLRRKLDRIEFGICHGTRRGLEQKWFAERLGCEVIGTEISDTATQFPNTVQWDFHEPNPDLGGQRRFRLQQFLRPQLRPRGGAEHLDEQPAPGRRLPAGTLRHP